MKFLGGILANNNDLLISGALYDNNKTNPGSVFDSPEPIIEPAGFQPLTVIVDEEKSNISGELRDRITCSTDGAGLLLVVSPKALELFEREKYPYEQARIAI